MYKKFFGFSEKPFNIVPNPKFLYHSNKHDNAITYLEYAITEGVGFTLLTGDVGTGKTTLIRHLLNQLGDEKNIAVVFNTNVNAEQLFYMILKEFELEPVPGDKTKNLEILNGFLIDCYRKKIDPVLIIDEAQNLSNDVLEDVRLLTNLQNDEQNLLQIILVGQPELREKMEDPSLLQLNQRVTVRYHLTALEDNETAEYIAARLATVGGKTDLFDEEAQALIYEASGGIPRLINLLCDSALVYAFADELKTITGAIIQQVIDDRGGMTFLKSSSLDVSPIIDKSSEATSSESDWSGDLSIIDTRLINLAKNLRRYQLGQEKQYALLEENIADVNIRLEKEKLKTARLVMEVERLKNHLNELPVVDNIRPKSFFSKILGSIRGEK